MNYFKISKVPDIIQVQTNEAWLELKPSSQSGFELDGVKVDLRKNGSGMSVYLSSEYSAVRRIVLRWEEAISTKFKFLGDHWERGYGDLEWRGMVPERIMPWYFMAFDGWNTHGYGVKTAANAMCFWQIDSSGISLCLDVRNGSAGVLLGNRELEAAVIVSREGIIGESPFSATHKFCRMMCDNPLLPAKPVYGGNNWYYAYGESSHQQILEDSKFIASLASDAENKPFMVIDDCWQPCRFTGFNGGPWNSGNSSFPDMANLASEMERIGVQPGIWFRPLQTALKVPKHWHLGLNRARKPAEELILDPSVPEVLEHISKDVTQFVSWGYKLIKHDFSTYDIFGKWGFGMGAQLCEDGWNFFDKSKTTAEIVLNLYKIIRKAAGDALIIGCNTIGHLGAGLFEIQRTGDDTSGLEWERTRKMGINTLAFRMPQHETFFAVDADCVGLTKSIPWELNKQWLEILASSGTPLFVSASSDAIGDEQRTALKQAFKLASKHIQPAEPLDWTETTCPSKWILNGNAVEFNWNQKQGIKSLV